MPVETADDRAAFVADFGVVASYNGAEINVIFDNEYIPVDTGASVAFAMQQPKALAITSQVSSAAEGDILTVNGIAYVIRVVMDDGTGMTELMLEAP